MHFRQILQYSTPIDGIISDQQLWNSEIVTQYSSNLRLKMKHIILYKFNTILWKNVTENGIQQLLTCTFYSWYTGFNVACIHTETIYNVHVTSHFNTGPSHTYIYANILLTHQPTGMGHIKVVWYSHFIARLLFEFVWKDGDDKWVQQCELPGSEWLIICCLYTVLLQSGKQHAGTGTLTCSRHWLPVRCQCVEDMWVKQCEVKDLPSTQICGLGPDKYWWNSEVYVWGHRYTIYID